MPQFFEWITSNFFVVIIIVGALLSVFGKKNAKPSGGEPFGGRAASRQNTLPRRAEPSTLEQERRSPFAGAPVRAEASERRAVSGKRNEFPNERSNIEQATQRMHEEIERRLSEQRSMQRRSQSVETAAKAIERAAAETNGSRTSRTKPAAKPAVKSPASADLRSALSAEDLRKGVLWAEVLGAPRAKKPYSSGRR